MNYMKHDQSRRDNYQAAVCSTCDGYHCKKAQVCVMSEDGSGPTCVENQTGCDGNDR